MVLEASNSPAPQRRRSHPGPDSSRKSKRSKLVSDDEYMLAGYLVALAESGGQKRVNSYTCGICGKSFPSHQALGGHKASHRTKHLNAAATDKAHCGPHPISGARHHCSTCGRSFATGQQLGGHMRKHYVGSPKIGANSSDGRNGGDESSVVTSYSDSGDVSYSDGELTKYHDLNLPPISSPELDLTLKL